MANIKSFPNNQDVYIGAEEVMKWLHGRTSGVFAAENNAAVTAVQNNMAVSVSDGTGWMSNAGKDGVVWWNDAEKTNGAKLQLSIDAADSTLDRIDRIIVEWKTTNYVDYPEIKVLKGTVSSTAAAPALTNNSTLRQISLARVSIPAGTTALTNSLVTDERLDASVCGLVTDNISVDTSMINNQVQAVLTETQEQSAAVLQAINDELAQLEAGTAVELKKLQFTNTTVAKAAFVADSTYQDYPYRASVTLTGVLSSMIPDVVLSLADAISGNFAPVAACYDGGIYLYAASAPDTAMTIPTIICWRGNT